MSPTDLVPLSVVAFLIVLILVLVWRGNRRRKTGDPS